MWYWWNEFHAYNGLDRVVLSSRVFVFRSCKTKTLTNILRLHLKNAKFRKILKLWLISRCCTHMYFEQQKLRTPVLKELISRSFDKQNNHKTSQLLPESQLHLQIFWKNITSTNTVQSSRNTVAIQQQCRANILQQCRANIVQSKTWMSQNKIEI